MGVKHDDELKLKIAMANLFWEFGVSGLELTVVKVKKPTAIN